MVLHASLNPVMGRRGFHPVVVEQSVRRNPTGRARDVCSRWGH